jgi:hypothetical protein
MAVPLDSDGFRRHECPNCERQFKSRPSQDDDPVEHVDQYFCPLCGRPAGLDSWWTPEQIEHAQAAVMPEAMQAIQDALGGRLRRASTSGLSRPVTLGSYRYQTLFMNQTTWSLLNRLATPLSP